MQLPPCEELLSKRARSQRAENGVCYGEMQTKLWWAKGFLPVCQRLVYKARSGMVQQPWKSWRCVANQQVRKKCCLERPWVSVPFWRAEWHMKVEKCQSSHLCQQVTWKPAVIRYSKKHGGYCPGQNAVCLTCQSGSLGSFRCEVGLAKQSRSFCENETFIWILQRSLAGIACGSSSPACFCRKQELVPGGWSPGWEVGWMRPSVQFFFTQDTQNSCRSKNYLSIFFISLFEKLQGPAGAG